jgi:NAD(P)-dependent dehydrogenase (short-subunit alcohol dehydrogenase family)
VVSPAGSLPAALSGRIALITGASRGIGAATALALARAGAHVVAVARTVGGLEELDDAVRTAGGTATLVPLDLTDTEGIIRLAAALQERYRRLDVLIGNAGLVGPSSPLDHVQPNDWKAVMAVNVTANWHLIRAMNALLRASDAGRAVFISSGAAHNMRAYRGPYSVSKAALEALVRTYAAETESTPVRVNLVNPGPTRTRMRAQVMPGEDPMTLPPPQAVAEKIVALCLPGFTASGRLYDYPSDRLLSFRKPEWTTEASPCVV